MKANTSKYNRDATIATSTVNEQDQFDAPTRGFLLTMLQQRVSQQLQRRVDGEREIFRDH